MKTLHWNGEHWYVNERSVSHRVRKWFVWFGGWERHSRPHWQFSIPYLSGKRLWMSPCPVSVFGHLATFYGHWMRLRLPSGMLVINFRERYAFISRDGTPRQAHCWLWGLHAKNWSLPDEARRLVMTPDEMADIA